MAYILAFLILGCVVFVAFIIALINGRNLD